MHRDKNDKKVVVVMEGSGGVVGLLRNMHRDKNDKKVVVVMEGSGGVLESGGDKG